jgi:coproporphyrinogen III oxidase-like Fe-S oxidoreductase
MKSDEPFGVYVHWPFCKAKCPYCDFNSHVRHGGIDEARFLAANLAELRHFAALAPRRAVSHPIPDAAKRGRSNSRRHSRALARRR